VKVKNPKAPAVTREAEADWGVLIELKQRGAALRLVLLTTSSA
jgi:hypothetical protein